MARNRNRKKPRHDRWKKIHQYETLFGKKLANVFNYILKYIKIMIIDIYNTVPLPHGVIAD